MQSTAIQSLQVLRTKVKDVVEARSGSFAVLQTLLWRLVMIGLQLINGVLVARHLGAVGRGQQATIVLWPMILPSLLELGVPFSLLYYARRDREQRAEYYGAGLVLALILGLGSCAVGVIGIPHWLPHDDPAVIRTAQIFMLFAPLSLLTYVVNAIIDAELAFGFSNILRYAPTVGITIALVGIVLTHHANPLTTALAYLAPNVILLAIIGIRVARRYKPVLRNAFARMQNLLTYGLRIHGTTVLNTFGQQIDQLLVVGLLEPGELGIYVVALSASRVLNIFQSSLLIVLLPKLVGREREEIGLFVGCVARITLTCTAIAALALSLALPFLMPKLYGQGFAAGVAVSQILIIESVLASTTSVLLQAYMALERPAIVTIFQALGLGLCVPIMLFTIPHFRLPGAALALLISTSVRLCSAAVGYPLVLKLPLPNLIPRLSDVEFLRKSFRLGKSVI